MTKTLGMKYKCNKNLAKKSAERCYTIREMFIFEENHRKM